MSEVHRYGKADENGMINILLLGATEPKKIFVNGFDAGWIYDKYWDEYGDSYNVINTDKGYLKEVDMDYIKKIHNKLKISDEELEKLKGEK